jgi:hypothetical protein
MQVDQTLRPQRFVQRRAFQVLTAPLAPRLHKATEPVLHVPVDLFKCHTGVTKTKVVAPSGQKPVGIFNHFSQWSAYPSLGQHLYSGTCPFKALPRRRHIQIAARPFNTAVEEKCKTEEVKFTPGLLQIDGACFVSIQDQSEVSQGLIHKRMDARSDVPSHNHPVVGVPDKAGIREITRTIRRVKPFIEFVQKDIRQQRRNYPSLCKVSNYAK